MHARQIIDDLRGFERNNSIKAIVLRIDSPGGAVGPSQEIYAAVKAVHKKPLIVSMGSVAASGGYYVAVEAQRIFANPGTITGSIGVIMEFPDLAGLLDKIGLHRRVVKSGEFKDIGSPVRDMTPEELALLQDLIDDVHAQFVDAVAGGRNIAPEKVRAFADGRIFSGRQAQALGLVDELGGLRAAITYAAKQVGIKGEPKVVYPQRPQTGLVDYLLRKTETSLQQYLNQAETAGLYLLWKNQNHGVE